MNKKIEEEFKPRTWLLIILIIIGLMITVVLTNKVIEDHNKRKAESKSIFDIFTNIFNNVNNQNNNFNNDEYDKFSEEIDKQVDQWKISSFNNEFESYAGTKSGFFVTHLLDEIITSNKTKKDHIITVSYNGTTTQDEETIRTIKSNFTKPENQHVNYEVILDYDENGYINKATIR